MLLILVFLDTACVTAMNLSNTVTPVFLLDISLAVSRWWICKTRKLQVRHWRRSACVFGSGCVKQKHHVRHWSLNTPIFWIFHWLRHERWICQTQKIHVRHTRVYRLRHGFESVRHRRSTLDTKCIQYSCVCVYISIYLYIYGCVTAMNLWNTETPC